MNKKDILQNYEKDEERILVAKILDKYEFTKTKNKIQYSDFLTLEEQEICMNVLKQIECDEFYFFGGKENSERKILVIYPEKLTEEMSRKNDDKVVSVIRIKLPNELQGQYEHRIYLGACMKLGVEREKIGDISVDRNGADIVIKEEIANFLHMNLQSLTRFKSAEITIENIGNLKSATISKIQVSAIVASLRLDTIVGVLAKTSRSKAVEIMKQERVFLNHSLETKPSKEVRIGDIITIRGKGRFEFKDISGNTKKGRYIILIDKYV